MMIRAFCILFIVAGWVHADPVADIDRLEEIDARIHEAAYFPGRGALHELTSEAALKSWTQSTAFVEGSLEDGVKSFRFAFAEGVLTGFFPVRHCCTEVILASLETTSDMWRFFGSLQVGSTAPEVLTVLGPAALTKDGSIEFCGTHDCAWFKLSGGRVTSVVLHFYTG